MARLLLCLLALNLAGAQEPEEDISRIGNEAIEIKVEMDALKKRSEEQRKLDPDFPSLAVPRGPGLILETFVVLGAILGLALVGYGLGWGGIAYARKRRTAIIKCPGCARKLRVPNQGRRVRVRCPGCGKESAYNPNKKKG